MEKLKEHEYICKTLTDMYEKKNHDYGDSFAKTLAKYGFVVPCIKLEEKLNRFCEIVLTGKQKVENESVGDTLLDLANYAILTLIEIRAMEE